MFLNPFKNPLTFFVLGGFLVKSLSFYCIYYFMYIFNHFFFNLFLFLLGLLGIIINRQSLILILISIELMLLAINLNFVFFSFYLDDILGELFALLILTVAAAESAIGLAIIIIFFRSRGTIAMHNINLLSN